MRRTAKAMLLWKRIVMMIDRLVSHAWTGVWCKGWSQKCASDPDILMQSLHLALVLTSYDHT